MSVTREKQTPNPAAVRCGRGQSLPTTGRDVSTLKLYAKDRLTIEGHPRGTAVVAYTINAAIDGHATVLATVDTAAMALAKVHSALNEYDRVWVTDELDRDIDLARLRELVNCGPASENF